MTQVDTRKDIRRWGMTPVLSLLRGKLRVLCVLSVLLCLCACRDKANNFVLEGNIGGLEHDTLYIYGADALYERIDTIVAEGGVFRYKAQVDTVTPLWVLFPNMHREMLFADKGLKTTMHGDTAAAGHIRVMGGEQNALLREFYHCTDSIDDAEERTAVADSFIRANPYSEVSIYLLREYFVHQLKPEKTKIKTLIGSMSGNLQDNNYIQHLQRTLDAYKPLGKSNTVSSFSVSDSEGERVNVVEYKGSYLLINFWASWDVESRQRQRELIALKEKYKKHNFDILSISLDTEREAWLQAINEDSVTWRQACDLDGWKTGIVERLQIAHLPANILIGPVRRVEAIDIYGDELDQMIAELTEEKKPETNKKSPATIRKIKKAK